MTVLSQLRILDEDSKLTSDDVFDAVFEAGSLLNDGQRENSNCLEIAIRLLDAVKNDQVPEGAIQVIEHLVEECGLYPYLNTDNFNLLTQTIISAHTIQLDEDVRLHAKQMQILLWLLAGDNIILSAPTSFGKTLLVDAFVSLKRPKCVVMIMPTIALIDETRRRLSRTFGSDYNLLTAVSDEYNPDNPTIFILTQERFLSRNDKLNIDLLFVDEFYKLDPSREDSRFERLNLAVYRALPNAKQSFFAGPHINDIKLGKNWSGNFRFVKTDYRTVTVNVVDRTDSEERLGKFLNDLRSAGEESSLVFTKSPPAARDLLQEILGNEFHYDSDIGPLLGQWIANNFHNEWTVAEGTQNGIAIHHGKLPRSLGQLFVQLFNEGQLKLLICTSTLIEGVNTSAANVYVYDKKISTTDFDFFSFANIRGRVGRMMRHYIGNVFLYFDPPEEIETNVDVPILSDPGSSTDYIVANVEPDLLSEKGVERRDQLPTRTGIEFHILKDFGSIGTDTLIELNSLVIESLAEDPELLSWKGFPTKEQRKHLAEIIVPVLLKTRHSLGLYTGAQVNWMWMMLQKCKTLGAFLRFFGRTFVRKEDGETVSESVENAFKFLQACEYTFPTIIVAVEALVKSNTTSDSANYLPFVSALENWFRPEWMKQIDEVGIPIPLSERLLPFIDAPEDRHDAMNKIFNIDLSNNEKFDDIDRYIIASAKEGR